MLKVKNIKKNYDDFTLDCSLEVRPGCITGLIGQNGAGKSTTFKAILNLIHLDGGEIELFGKSATALTAADKQRLGVALSNSGFSGNLTISDISHILGAMYKKYDNGGFISQCRKFGLPLDKNVSDFSTGMKAKLKILVALSHRADFLILDEPTAGLDPKERIRVKMLLQQLAKDRIILIATHIVPDIENIAEAVLVLKDGSLLPQQTAEQLLAHYAPGGTLEDACMHIFSDGEEL